MTLAQNKIKQIVLKLKGRPMASLIFCLLFSACSTANAWDKIQYPTHQESEDKTKCCRIGP